MTTEQESGFVGPVQWVQAERHPTSKQRDPIQGEFFNTDSITTLAAKLTREGIGQNPMDAATAQPVRVRVYVSGEAGAVSALEASPYFDGLRKHVEVCDPAAAEQLDGPCQFLVIEDFNTTGLTGDESATEEPPPNIANDFFYFFRAEGKSGKSGADRGRWGVGKYVFPMASHVNTFFGLTVRAPDGTNEHGPLLMGQAVLKNHRVAGKSYEPDGWWSAFDDRGVPVPLIDEAIIDDFRRTWNVRRQAEPGLSVVIPYVRPELDAHDLKRAIVLDYFIAILSGRFIAEIDSPELDETLVIGPATLEHVVQTLADPDEREEISRQITLALWDLTLPDHERVAVQKVTSGPPRWSPELIAESDRVRIRTALANGERVSVRVPVEVHRRQLGGSDARQWSYMDVVLAGESGFSGRPRFVREGLFVPEVNSPTLSSVRALVTIDDEELARMVGDAEGPAHTNWTAQTDKFSGNYGYGQQWLTFIKRAPAEILRIARGEDEEADPTLMASFFPMPSDTGPSVPEGPEDEPGPDGPDDLVDPPPGRPQTLRVRTISGGFSVHLTEHGQGKVGQIRIATAYDRRRGNAFKRWRPEDFELADSSFDIEIEGGSVRNRTGNELVVSVDDDDTFSLHVRGFDENRDVRVKTETEGVA